MKTQPSQQRRCIIYARTSSEDQDDAKTSINDQISDCKAHAAKQGYEVAGAYEDRDLSGRLYPQGDEQAPLDLALQAYLEEHKVSNGRASRKGLAQALTALRPGNILLVRELRRFARPLVNSQLPSRLTQLLVKAGATLESVAEGKQDPKDYNQVLFKLLDETLADKDVQKRVAECKRALRGKRDSGMLTGKPTCYGYRSGGLQKVQAVQEELEIVKWLYAQVIAGKSIASLVKELNHREVRGQIGGAWNHRGIWKILRRPCYAGLRLDSTGKLIPSLPHQGFEAVSVSDWHKVQQINKTRSLHGSRDHDTIRPLAGLIYCGTCGRLMSRYASNFGKGINGDSLSYYRCMSVQEQQTCQDGCRKSMVRETETSKGDNIGGLLECLRPLAIAALAVMSAEEANKSDTSAIRLAEIEGELAKLVKDSSRAYKDHTSGLLPMEVLTQVLTDFDASKKSLEAERDNLRTKTVVKPQDGLQLVYSLISGAVDPAGLRRALRATISKVSIYSDHITVALQGGKEFDLPRIKSRNARLFPRGFTSIPEQLAGAVKVLYFVSNGKGPETLLAKQGQLSIIKVG